MASITSMVNGTSSLTSIYGNRNVLSGLASGMDTESMIENAVSGIKLKIQNLQKRRTKIEWQQEAYRSIIDKAVNFNTKYTSYSSKTNLLSNSFFTNAVNTTTAGTYADKVTATGKTSSDIKINSVKQLAKAASYTVSGLAGASGDITGITGKDFDIGGTTKVSNVSGSLTFQYGGTNGTTFDISFDELEDLNEVEVLDDDGNVVEDASPTAKLAQAIQNKLNEVTYSYTKNGFQETTTAGEAIKVTANADGTIGFEDGLGNGNKVSISSSDGEIEKYAGSSVIRFGDELTRDVDTVDYLSNKELGITFNGTTKKISMTDVIDRMGEVTNDNFVDALQKELNSAFGSGKIDVSFGDGKLSFSTEEGDTMAVGGSAVKALGFETGDSNYVNTGKKLSDILGSRASSVFTNDNLMRAVGSVKTEGDHLVDEAGNTVKLLTDENGSAVKDADGNDIYYRVDKDGKALYDFQINGTSIAVNEDTTLESLMNSINSNAEAGVKVSYSKLTNEFKFTATETGSNGKIEFGGLGEALFGGTNATSSTRINEILGGRGEYSGYGQDAFKIKIGGVEITANVWSGGDDPESGTTIQSIVNSLNGKSSDYTFSYDEQTNSLKAVDSTGKEVAFEYGEGVAKDLFGKIEKKYTAGQDAIMDVEINGKRFDSLTRSSNNFDLDGLSITVKGTFDEVGKDGADYEPITFNTTTDSDKIIDAIRDFVNDYNEMVTELKSQYSTTPAQKSNGSRYDPLTAEEEDGYSESELAAYNEKAKQGILFGDSTLSSMYSKLLSAIAPGGSDGQTLREIGLTTSYSNGLTTLSLDEDKLRATLDSDPDKVRNAFAKTKEGGSSSDGLMQTMQNTLNTYVKTTGEPKGVLITRAGSIKAPTSLNSNSLKSQMDSIDSQIERWQDKMSDQIDRYTTQFSRLEQLIAEMNSQASALSGLMGGSTGY